ncbi:KWG leptospira [Clostridium ragsdalei P11]|uniref:KWG leptospira n=1 Tax=Clostridium ragsdalei P11 TaxID=1353534 RepID=A0A1A6AIJ7_9CLOT|nr:WG repeat-containing protein [Clostridium ragsdalei]OBR89871.1 KWG leptospira [Clostridium ragsdalei P11]
MKKVSKKYLSLIFTFILLSSTGFTLNSPKVSASNNLNYSITDLNMSCANVYAFEGNLAKFQNNNFYGLISKDGSIKLPAEFTSISSFKNGYAKVAKGSKFGFVNENGSIVVEPQFEEVSNFFTNGLAAVKQNSKWGLINSSGKIVTEPQYDAVYGFYNGLMRVRKGSSYGFLKSDGTLLSGCNYANAYDFNDGYAAVEEVSTWGLIDKSGNFKSFNFDELKSPILGLIPVKKDKHWGLSDMSGKIVLEPKYTDISYLNSNLIKVSSGDKRGAIDKKGNLILDLNYDSIIPADDGMCQIVQNGQYGLIDPTGKIIVHPQFSWIDTFQEGKAIVCSQDQYGFIDTKGELTHESQFDKVYAFKDGMARIDKNGKYGFINSKGDVVIDPIFENASDFNEGYAAVKKNTGSSSVESSDDSELKKEYIKWGYIDRLGSTFISYDFDSASGFNDGCSLAVKDGKCNIIKNPGIKSIPSTAINNPFKTWKIKFSKAIDGRHTLSNKDDTVLNDIDMTMTDNISVTDSSKKYANVSFTFEGPDTIVINPPSNGYTPGEIYTITVLSNGKYNIQDISGNKLKPNVTEMKFQVLDN